MVDPKHERLSITRQCRLVQPFPFGRPIRLTHNKWEDSLAEWAAGEEATGREVDPG